MKKVLTQTLLVAALLAGTHNVLAENTTMTIMTTQHAPAGL